MLKPTDKHNLGVLYPGIAAEWHPNKNVALSPKDVRPSSNKKVWWRCSKGHEWVASVSNRSKGKKCPYCANRKVSVENCLETVNPVLAREWNSVKNSGLTPKDVTPGSSRKVWWKCDKGHEWLTAVGNRARGTGCPYCSGKFVNSDNCLLRVAPHLVKEWHPTRNGNLTPDKVTAGSGRKIWWKCIKGHEWEASVYTRVSGVGCPSCSPSTSFRELRIYCELKELFGRVLLREKIGGVECDIFVPDIGLGIEVDGAYWHKNKHAKDVLKNKILQERGVFLLRVREEGLQKISSSDVIIPKQKKDYEVMAQVLAVIKGLPQLPDLYQMRIGKYISEKKLINESAYVELCGMLPTAMPGKSLGDLNPKLAREWHPTKNGSLTPKAVTLGSGMRVWWKCIKGHAWQATTASRNNGTGCPFCSNQAIGADNSLAVVNRALAEEWHPSKNSGLTPDAVAPRANKKVWWKCSKGHEWQAVISSRARGYGCPYCANKVANKENCLAVSNPKLTGEWHPTKNGSLTPWDVLSGTEKKAWWLCGKGHVWQALINSRARGVGCPYCANKAVNWENSLATLNPSLAKEWHPTRNKGLTAKDVTKWSNKKVWWKCSDGHEWEAYISNRSRGRGCPHCSKDKTRK